ncbi:MAG: sigma 54-interacting transcriptional regulator [Deltaproteobacteria bacterium]|nr:sigma 54-interacting transcriptional regulator [Deltaproteobacteria bacterium]
MKWIDHKYEVLEELGSGQSGEVYRVKFKGKELALKLLKTELANSPEILNKESDKIRAFKFEFALLKGLQHKNIVQLFDFGQDQELKRLYYTQEFIPGQALSSPKLKLTQTEKQDIFLQALRGLAYLHRQKILHGDLKPENLLIVAKEESNQQSSALLKIIDFGLSLPQLALKGGTPAYMPPEKILREPVDSRSDLYSLAVIFYQVLTGKHPFARKNLHETLQAQLQHTAPSATLINPEIPPIWSQLLDRMLIKNPQERISSAEACIKFLESKGEVSNFTNANTEIQEAWIGREDILESCQNFLSHVAQQKEKKAIERQGLILTGEVYSGQSALLSKLKYEAELLGLEIRNETEESSKKISEKSKKLQLLDWSQLGRSPDKTVNQQELVAKLQNLNRQKSHFILAIPATLYPELIKNFAPHQSLALRSFTALELEAYLKKISGNPEIPPPFLNSLYQKSHGNSHRIKIALNHLSQDPRIVDSSGKWNLAIFREVAPSMEQLGLTALRDDQTNQIKEIDSLQKWDEALFHCLNLARQKKHDAALKRLQILEEKIGNPDFISNQQEAIWKKAKVFGLRSWIYLKQNRYEEARKSLNHTLELLKESGQEDPILQLRSQNFLSYLDLQEGKIEEAISSFEKTSKITAALPPEQQFEITNNELSRAYLAAERFEEAIEQIKKDLRSPPVQADISTQLKSYYHLAEAYEKLLQYSEAISAFEEVENRARQAQNWDYLVRAYNGLGNIHYLKKELTQALDYFERSFSLAEYTEDYAAAASARQSHGVILGELDQLEEALIDLEASKRALAKLPPTTYSRHLMSRAVLELGEIYLKQKNFQKAHSAFSEALNRSEEEESLHFFRFYPLLALAKLALLEKNSQSFQEIYPQVLHLAQSPEQKEDLAKVMKDLPFENNLVKPEKNLLSIPQNEKPVSTNQISSRQNLYQSSHTFDALPQTHFSGEALLSILKINRALLSEMESPMLFQKILEYATDLSGAESALLLEVSEDNALSILAAFNTQIDDGQKEISEHIASQVLRSGKSIVTHDALDDESFNQYQSVLALKLRSVACVPIRIHQKVIGLLYLIHRNKIQLFSQEVLSLLEAYSDQAGLALQNNRYLAELKKLNQQLREKLDDAESFIDQLKEDMRTQLKNPYPKILGQSPAIVQILENLDRISDTELSVLILGETGTGKELIARAIHENSHRRSQPFIAINCGAIPENIIESELFGYVAGAFTGASRDKKGLFEAAHGGTIFLDEVAELPLQLQVKLLRVLQEKEVVRVGSSRPIAVDFRLVAATHRQLESWVSENKFREDLYYRLAQMLLHIPSLRERMEDLPLLANHFLNIFSHELKLKQPPKLSQNLFKAMSAYHWPGNVRELENMIRTASAFANEGNIELKDLPDFLRQRLEGNKAILPQQKKNISTQTTEKMENPRVEIHSQKEVLEKWEDYEAALYNRSYQKFQGDYKKIAEDLEVGIATVYSKVRKFSLEDPAQNERFDELVQKIPHSITASNLKIFVIQKTFTQTKSPYSTAQKLGINVGTVYRYLKSTHQEDKKNENI